MKEIDWNSDTTSALMALLRVLDMSSRFGMYDKIDLMILNMPYETGDLTMLIGILRYTFRYRSILPSWKPAVMILHNILESRGEDAKSQLQGLYEE